MSRLHATPSRTYSLEGAVGAVWIVLVALVGTNGVAAPASGTGRGAAVGYSSAPMCASSAVREVASTNRKSYGPGSIVKMTSSIRNKSKTTCSVLVGPTSPSFSVTNSRGVDVWNNCYADDQPGACPEYLIARNLKPGATYSGTVAWDHRSGKPPDGLPVGGYELTTHFVGIAGNHSSRFQLTSSRTITVTQADSGRSYTVRVGDRLVVQLSGPSIYTWTEPVSSDQAVLRRTWGTSGSEATATFVAEAKGEVKVTATDNPNCYPQCLAPSLLFVVSVSVLSVGACRHRPSRAWRRANDQPPWAAAGSLREGLSETLIITRLPALAASCGRRTRRS